MSVELIASMREYMKAYEKQDAKEIDATGSELVKRLTGKDHRGNTIAVELYEDEGFFERRHSKMTHKEYLENLVRIGAYQYGKSECAAAAKSVVDAIVEEYPSEECTVDKYRSHQEKMDEMKFGMGATRPREENREKISKAPGQHAL